MGKTIRWHKALMSNSVYVEFQRFLYNWTYALFALSSLFSLTRYNIAGVFGFPDQLELQEELNKPEPSNSP